LVAEFGQFLAEGMENGSFFFREGCLVRENIEGFFDCRKVAVDLFREFLDNPIRLLTKIVQDFPMDVDQKMNFVVFHRRSPLEQTTEPDGF